MKPKAIIFDFFGVIAADMYILWLKRNGFTEKIPELIKTHFQYSDLGVLHPHDLYSYFASLVNRPINEIQAEIEGDLVLDEDVLSFIKSCRSDSHLIAVCSNAPSGIVESFLEEKGVSHYFDHIVTSSKLGARKPDEIIFRRTLELLNTLPRDAVFVDDKEENVEAAKKLGLKGVLFRSASDLEGIL